MIVTWLGHASLFLNAGGKTLLVDPWFAEPTEEGWHRYPPAPYAVANAMPRPDFLLLSHASGTSCSARTLAQLKKDTRTLALPFEGLKTALGTAGFSNVTWVDAWISKELSPGLKVTFVPTTDGAQRTAIVVEADGVRLYHGHDFAPDAETYRDIATRHGPIDLAFFPYTQPGGTKAQGLQRLFDGLSGLRPKEAAPFGASWAVLKPEGITQRFVDHATPEEALASAMKVAHEHGSHLARLEPGDEWSPDTGAINKGLVEEWTNDVTALARYAQTIGPSRT